ncbi:MAG: hypothetical protein GF344_17150, partial [Chitinivibrionales bacterium]|nr:hypothetical protein [Chitinivibrionales bacterium]
MPNSHSDNSSQRELPFEGFAELIARPLAESDPRSFERIRRLFLTDADSRIQQPFSFLMKRITGKTLDEATARRHWRKTLEHKADMEAKLGRVVAIQAAAVDYFAVEETPR